MLICQKTKGQTIASRDLLFSVGIVSEELSLTRSFRFATSEDS